MFNLKESKLKKILKQMFNLKESFTPPPKKKSKFRYLENKEHKLENSPKYLNKSEEVNICIFSLSFFI